MSIYLTRHAESSHNRDNIIAGCRLDTKITQRGALDAEKLALKLFKNLQIEVIIGSGLKRSLQTAEIFARVYAQIHGRKLPLVKTNLINEVDVGDLSGLTASEAAGRLPKDFAKLLSDNIKDWSFPNGESPQLLDKRCIKFVKLLKEYQGKNILVVGHAMFNQVLARNIGGISLKNFSHDQVVRLTI